MKTIMLQFLATVFLVAAFAAQGHAGDDFTPNVNQIKFADMVVTNMMLAEEAIWKNHMDLWVAAPIANAKMAKNIASDVIALSNDNLRQIFCVHVHSGDWKELYSMCWTP